VRLPAFIEELRGEAYHAKLVTGVWSGYAVALAFAVLAAGGVVFDLSPHGPEFLVLLAVKLVTNTATLVALRRRSRWALDLMSLNTTADIVCMTGAVYLTGGPASPLFAVYVIEVTVVALLSNLGTTLVVAAGVVIAFGVMCTLVAAGVLPPTEPPVDPDLRPWHVGLYMAFAAFAIGVPTLYTSRILQRLRDREVKLEARTAQLIEAGRQRGVFLASVTHELRTPIHGIQGLADLIASGVYGPATPRQQDASASIKRSAQSLLHLIDDLLALVKADVGRLEIKPAPVDLDELVGSVTASVQWMLGTKQLRLSVALGDTRGPVISDRRLLGHVLVNLVANAAKFTPEGGQVTIRAGVEGDRLVLAVSDTGIGIPEDQQQAVFEAFRQVDGSDERSYGGVGLGLALVRRLCDLLGGKVSVTSAVGQGSTFTVDVPAVTPGAGAPALAAVS